MSIVDDLLAESQRLTEYADGFAQVMTANETTDVPFEGYPDSPSLAKRVGQYLEGTGYVLELDTTTGGTITKRNELIKWKTADGGDESWYRWDGTLNKVVSAGYNLNTDGIGLGLWINVGDAALRSELPQINALSGNAVFATFADLGTGTTKDGVLGLATIQAMHTAGTKVRTELNNLTSNAGGASYKILTAVEKDASGYTGTEGYACIEISGSGYWACLVREFIKFDSVADLKLTALPTGFEVGRYYYSRGDSGYATGIIKTAAQAATDGDVIDGHYNVTLANGNVWVGEGKLKSRATQWGVTGAESTVNLQAFISQLKPGAKLTMDTNTIVNDVITFPLTDGWELEFIGGCYIEQTVDKIVLAIGDGTFGSTTITNFKIFNPRIVTQGYGQNNAGLIQINNAKDGYIKNTRIFSNNASAISREKLYNGIATAINVKNITFDGYYVEGTPKSGLHISTGSREVYAYRGKVLLTGNHDPITYGYSPAVDCQADDSIISDLYAENVAGEVLLINGETSTVAGWGTFTDRCKRTKFQNIVGLNCGTNGVRIASLDIGVTPFGFELMNVDVDTCGGSGLEIGSCEKAKVINFHAKNTQLHAFNVTSDTESIDVELINCIAENWALADSTNYKGLNVGTSNNIKVTEQRYKHDGVGVTHTPVCIGAPSGKTITRLDINQFYTEGTVTRFAWFSIPNAGRWNYGGVGAPTGGSQAPNGSTYQREDGIGVNDNFYIRQEGSWVGIA